MKEEKDIEFLKFRSKWLVAYLRHHYKKDKEGVMCHIWNWNRIDKTQTHIKYILDNE